MSEEYDQSGGENMAYLKRIKRLSSWKKRAVLLLMFWGAASVAMISVPTGSGHGPGGEMQIILSSWISILAYYISEVLPSGQSDTLFWISLLSVYMLYLVGLSSFIACAKRRLRIMALAIALIFHGVGVVFLLSKIDYGKGRLPNVFLQYCIFAGIAFLSYLYVSYRLAGQSDTLGPARND
jgi:hypothetical protein